MDLLLRVTGDQLPASRDVVVACDDRHTVADLCAAIADHFGIDVPALVRPRATHRLEATMPIVACGLASGDEIVVAGRIASGGWLRSATRAIVDVVAGPDAGRSGPLGARAMLGRAATADFVLRDPMVSRRHVEVLTESGRVSVCPVDPVASAVAVNGARISEATPMQDGDVIAIGNTHLTVRHDVDGDGRRVPERGEVPFRRPPRRPPNITEGGTIVIGPIPEERDPRRFQVLTLAAPLAAGLLMFAFSHQLEFLALMLLSPLVLVATTIDDRRAGRRGRRRELAAFHAMIAARSHEAAAWRERERIERLGAAPDLAQIVQLADRVTNDLWQRRPGDHDFLRVRVGTGAVPARFDVAIEPGGSNALRGEAAAAVAGWTAIERVPVCVDLAGNTVAIHGDRARVDALAAAVIVQLACLHSPEEVVIAAAIRPGRSFSWLKWLPHVGRAADSTGCALAWTPDETTDLVARLSDLASSGPDACRVIAVVDGALVRPADAVRLRELAQQSNMGVVWLADDVTSVPTQATHVIDVEPARLGSGSSRLWSAGDATEVSELEDEGCSPAVAERVAMSLAPVRDIGWSAESAVPDSVTLFEALGRVPSAATVGRAWRSSQAVRLDGALGVGSDGAVVIDLIADGPHMLVAGTTGSGKSELLQSIVATFAARHSPSRLNFLFVDYKGGATSSAFERLPHNVGAVTNLDAASARRAIVSLRAELDRRMALFDGQARDLGEMLTRFPDLAPPSLVIVIDEFATIATQLPEFVTGVIDIAQRGRSLGVHLVLSTQRAAGSIDERILANTNLRVSLRVIDRADSTSVVGTAAAAEIPATRRGRGVARIGTRSLFVFQGAYGGGPAVSRSERRQLSVSDFARPGSRVDQPRAHQTHDLVAASQLAAVVDAVVAAHAMLGSPAPRRPWCDPLPSLLALDSETAERGHGEPGRFLTIGRFDAPERQAQGALTIDLECGGGCVIFGSGGSGKTTALRTIALELSATCRGGELALLAFDCASGGLKVLAELPDVIDVATGEDIEAITRHIVMLDAELARRRRTLSAVSAEHLSAYNARNPAMPRIVVLVDGFSGLAEILYGRGGGHSFGGESWLDRLVRILVDGRQVGIHAVLTSDRRNALPARLLSAISNRIVLKHADPLAYAEHGIAIADTTCGELPPGRGWWNATTPVQLAVVSADHTASAQSEAIALAAAQIARRRTEVLCSSPLPTRVVTEAIAAPRHSHVAPIGVEDVTGAIVTLDLTRSHAAVVGGPRSGRSTALATLARTFTADHDVLAVGPAGCGLASVGGIRTAFGPADVIGQELERFAIEAGGRRSRPAVLIVDDLDQLDQLDPSLAPCWARLVATPHLRIVAATRTEAMIGFVSDPLAAALRRSRQLLALAPDDAGEFLQLTGVKLDVRPGVRWVPGRGVLVTDRLPQVLQVAFPCEAHAERANVRTHVRSRASVAA